MTITVRVTDDNIGTGTVHGGWNSNYIATELVPSGPAGGISDNMGNHSASQNITLGSYWLSGDGGSEGIFVNSSGNVGVGTNSPGTKLQVSGNIAGDNFVGGTSTTNFQLGFYSDDSYANGWQAYGATSPNPNTLQAVTNGSPRFTISGTSNVGIGSTNPTVALDVSGDIRATSSTSNSYVVSATSLNGAVAQVSMADTGACGTTWSLNSGNSTTGGGLGNKFGLAEGSTYRMVVAQGGNIGIGMTSPGTYKMYVAGGMVRMDGGLEVHGLSFDGSGHYVCRNTVTGEITYSAGACSASDERLKSNVQSMNSSIDDLLRLRPVTFEWSDPHRPRGPQIGFIAQEVQQVFPELVQKNENGLLSLDYAPLVATIVSAVKEIYAKVMSLVTSDQQQSRQIASQKTEIEALKAEDKRKAQEIEALRSYLCQRDPKAPFCASK